MTRLAMPIRALLLGAGILAFAASEDLDGRSATPADDAFAAYWNAATLPEASTAAAAVVTSGVSFDDAYARLKAGRRYAASVARGIVKGERRAAAGTFPYSIDVPPAYDPATRYGLRVQLHGGVGRPEPGARGDGSIGTLAGDEQIYLLPQAWAAAQWWEAAQDENLPALVDLVKRRYNVDENRIVVSGVSDGGTGAFYVAMRDTTPYASFLPLNGFILVLANRGVGVDGPLFPHNMINKPFFAVNGGRDPLYPTSRVEPYLRHFVKHGLTLVYHPQPEAGHNTAWWPQEKAAFEQFVREHPRDPHPARLSWQTDGVAGRSRAHWLVVDRLAASRSGAPLPDLNDFAAGEAPNFGVRTDGMRVTGVVPGSNAQILGFAAGDVVLGVNGRDLPGGLDLVDFLGLYDAGAALTFSVQRGATHLDLKGTYQPTVMARVAPLFPDGGRSGRVDVVREGNTFRATTRGIAAFTLLLSPDVVDFSQPVTVVADGRTVFAGRVSKSVDTLLTWAARDNDRTMLYGAALPVALP